MNVKNKRWKIIKKFKIYQRKEKFKNVKNQWNFNQVSYPKKKWERWENQKKKIDLALKNIEHYQKTEHKLLYQVESLFSSPYFFIKKKKKKKMVAEKSRTIFFSNAALLSPPPFINHLNRRILEIN